MYEPLYTSTLQDVMLIAAYLLAASAILYIFPRNKFTNMLFGLLNVGAVYYAFFHDPETLQLSPFAVLIGVLVAHWCLLKTYFSVQDDRDSLYYLSFLLPIVLLFGFKGQSTLQIIGVSYLAFRMSLASFELRGRKEPLPLLLEYLGYLVFPLTFLSGPINPIKNHIRSLAVRQASVHNFVFGMLRLLIGYIKYRFMANVVHGLTFSVAWETGYPMTWIDFFVSGAAFYLYLYLNFSGYTDMMIGMAAILGIKVKENFNNPLMAVSIIDFWRRWHLSLTDFVKDAAFTPVLMSLTRFTGGKYYYTCTVVAVFTLFTVLALWHGTGVGFFIFYGIHAVMFSITMVAETHLKKVNRTAFNAYSNSAAVAWSGRVFTFVVVAISHAFIELYTWEKITQTVNVILS